MKLWQEPLEPPPHEPLSERERRIAKGISVWSILWILFGVLVMIAAAFPEFWRK